MGPSNGSRALSTRFRKLKGIFHKNPKYQALSSQQEAAQQAPDKRSLSLWDQAYQELREENSELVDKYEERVSLVLDGYQSDPTSKENLDRIMTSGLKRMEEAKIQIAGLTIQESMAKVANFVTWAKDWIDQAVESSPQASIAWSIISLGIPFLTYPAAAEKDCKEGFTFTVSRMKYYAAIETAVHELGNHMDPTIVAFYKAVLDFQIRCVLRFYRSGLSTFARDVIQSENWKELLGNLIAAEKQLHQDLVQSSSLATREELVKLGAAAGENNQLLRMLVEVSGQQLEFQNRIQDYTLEGLQLQQHAKQYALNREAEECLQTFRLTEGSSGHDQSYEAYKNRNAPRLEGTCLWFLNHPNFVRWSSQSSGPLLVTADPGCGKSVLAAHLVDEISKQSPVCYFFFKDQVQDTVTQALCALLHQLFSFQFPLIEHAMPLYKKNGQGLVKITYLLWLLFFKVLDSFVGPVTVVLDALDECKEGDRKEFLSELSKYMLKASAKFLLTSRPYDHVTGKLTGLAADFPHIRIPGEDLSHEISPEIDLVIIARVDQLATELSLGQRMKSHVLKRLLEVPQRTYLWVDLVLDYLEDGFQQTSIGFDKHIKELPTTVHEAYERILTRYGQSRRHSRTRSILSIILAAETTLSINELHVALELEQSEADSLSQIQLEEPNDFKQTLRRECGLIVVIEHDLVYFLHQTVRDFLLANPSGGQWQGSFNLETAHDLMSAICINYLHLAASQQYDLSALTQRFNNLNDPENHVSGSGLDVLALNEYACSYWDTHYEKHNCAEDLRAICPLRTRALQLCLPKTDVFAFWNAERILKIYWNQEKIMSAMPGATDLMVIVQFQIYNLFSVCLLETDINAQTTSGWTALHEAIRQQDSYAVTVLLENGALVDTPIRPELRTELHRAVLWNNLDNIEAMIKRSRNVNTKDFSGSTPLHDAILHHPNMLSIAELLLEHGADVHARTNVGYTPIYCAIRYSTPTMVQLLLKHGASLNFRTKTGRGPLHIAAVGLDPEMISFLVAQQCNVNARDAFNRTPLHHAFTQYFSLTDVIIALLACGADVNAQDYLLETPLQLSFSTSRLVLVSKLKALLDNGADVNLHSSDGTSALQYAYRRGHQAAVEMLLAADAQTSTERPINLHNSKVIA